MCTEGNTLISRDRGEPVFHSVLIRRRLKLISLDFRFPTGLPYHYPSCSSSTSSSSSSTLFNKVRFDCQSESHLSEFCVNTNSRLTTVRSCFSKCSYEKMKLYSLRVVLGVIFYRHVWGTVRCLCSDRFSFFP